MNVVSLLASIVGIAGLTGGAAGYFSKSRGDTIISLQGKEIDYWKAKSDESDKQNTRLTAENAEKDKRIEALIGQNKQLAELGQGSPEIKKLRRDISELKKLVK